MAEAIEHLFHADGRLVRTLPRLAFHPASLTRDYLTGKRVSQTPPFRLFLVVILLFFFAGGIRDFVKPSTVRWFQADAPTKGRTDIQILGIWLEAIRSLAAWLKPRLTYVAAHPRELAMGMADWMHRIAIMLLPISTLVLSLLFAFQRRFFVFDHAIFSMHSLSFMGLLATAITLTSMVPLLAGLVEWMSLHRTFDPSRRSYARLLFHEHSRDPRPDGGVARDVSHRRCSSFGWCFRC